MELVQDHSEAQLEEDREADEHAEVCRDVNVAHVVEPEDFLAVACEQIKSSGEPPTRRPLDFDTASHKKACSPGC